MSFEKTDVAVDKLANDIQDKMKSIVKDGVYGRPGSANYARTGDLLNSIQKKVECSGSGMNRNYTIKVYFDTKLIRPQVSSNPKMYNQHMTGRGSSKNPKDVSSLLPEWYDEGFRRGKEEIKLDILDKTKKAFPIDRIKQIVGEDLLKVATEGLQKYKK